MASDSGNFFSGLIIGGAIGAIAGILFAPKAGRDFRDELLGDSDEIINKAKSELDKIRAELGDLKEKITHTMDRKGTKTKPSDIAEERDFEESLNAIDEDDVAAKGKKAKK